ncbi:related to Protein KTI12 [Saccharomycodes ludwigii]|uniref:Related to Protein KTI12 n=1 Tax=Saccharomycodes ludwigii TaxID=36035 RepID=A0A376B7L1_9ASCO|nr:hypothetical protein SCDLUD_004076 [Saccharomycodes ludwigii]KAH3899785.1 hypothetical protein SCDLUD_004076 [Saccharomycodes ludwigii]SSD60673.1 related to Protein KTI12 [Saccharomycodes ludwigii]
MPLVLLTGYPCSGKTTVSKELIILLESQIKQHQNLSDYKINYYNDEMLGISHSDYKDAKDEKKLRSKIMSVVKRDLTRKTIVIIDSLNYIKGFRYQLHCEVKNINTTFLLIHMMANKETIINNNNNNSGNDNAITASTNRWNEDLLVELINRYEEPNPNNRWDFPCLPLLFGEDKLLDYSEDILKYLFPIEFHNKDNDTNGDHKNNREIDTLISKLKPNNATILKPSSTNNYLQNLDKVTTSVIKTIMNYYQVEKGGYINHTNNRCIIKHDANKDNTNDIDACVWVDLPIIKPITIAQLQRLKRQFIALNRIRNLGDEDRILVLFTGYLNKNFSNT